MSPGARSALRSAWVIWPAFSARDMRPTRSATRCFTGNFAFWYGSPWASMTTCGFSRGALAPVTVSSSGTVFASDALAAFAVRTVTLWLVPEAVPAGKVWLPVTGV